MDEDDEMNIGNDVSEDDDNFSDTYDEEGDEFLRDNTLAGGDASRKALEKGSTPYKCLAADKIGTAMTSSIKEANNFLQLPETTVRLLLTHYKWDKDRLLEKYFEDASKTFADANLADPRTSSSSQKSSSSSQPVAAASGKKFSRSKSGLFACDICFDTIEDTDSSSLACGHKFCNECWANYIKSRLSAANEVIRCPDSKCQMLADDNVVRERLRGDPAALRRFDELISQSFVSDNHLMKWCASAKCDRAFQLASKDWVALECDKCRSEWCSTCPYHWHYPVTCQYFKKWLKKNADDSETANWINANTKDCPHCSTAIEKNGGCNHMTCRSKACKHEFCWVCMQDWAKHVSGNAYNCNRFEEDKVTSNKEQARVSLQRYLFFFTRYANHEKSRELEKKLQATVELKIEELQTVYQMARPEALFLQQALNTLSRCRRTLMYTYAFAYFLRKNCQCEIFLDNQSNLESATEGLSEYLEKEFEDVPDVHVMKQKVQDKARYCEQRRQRLIEHVQDGYIQRWWDMTD